MNDELDLVKGDKAISVSFKRSSLCIPGNIRMVEDTKCLSFCALQLKGPLQRVRTTWTKLGPYCYGIKTYASTADGPSPKHAVVSNDLGETRWKVVPS